MRLREVIQVFNDGRFRSRLERQAAVSEKTHKGEDEGASILRALGEELGCKYVDSDSLMPLTTNFVKKESQSYPGLITEYKIRYVMFHVDDLFFCSEGYVEIQKDKKTYFAWEKV